MPVMPWAVFFVIWVIPWVNLVWGKLLSLWCAHFTPTILPYHQFYEGYFHQYMTLDCQQGTHTDHAVLHVEPQLEYNHVFHVHHCQISVERKSCTWCCDKLWRCVLSLFSTRVLTSLHSNLLLDIWVVTILKWTVTGPVNSFTTRPIVHSTQCILTFDVSNHKGHWKLEVQNPLTTKWELKCKPSFYLRQH